MQLYQLPKSHLRCHRIDKWSPFCEVCRSALQRRKSARRQSIKQDNQVPIAAAFGEELHLDPVDYMQSSPDSQPFHGLRYDYAFEDTGTGCRGLIPAKNLFASTLKTVMRENRRENENIKRVTSDSDSTILRFAGDIAADKTPKVPYRPQQNRIERTVEILTDT